VVRVLVLGGGGFLGRHVLEAFAADPEATVWPAGRSEPAAEADRWSPVDLLDPGSVRRLLASVAPEVVVNCAGRTTGSEGDLARATVDLVGILIDAMRDEAPTARLVHLGSAAEYGPGTPGVPLAEDAPSRPTSVYGRLKAQASGLVMGADLDAIVLRVFNPVGAGAPSTSVVGHAVELLRAAADATSPTIVMGPLDAHRDFVHGADVGDAVVAAGRVAHPEHRLLNAGSGRARQVREIVRLLASIAGFDGEIREDAAALPRSAAVDWQEADTSRAHLVLGWSARREISDALERAWRSAGPLSPG
jgi:nucleoside-diphosphate-sugar epimerase